MNSRDNPKSLAKTTALLLAGAFAAIPLAALSGTAARATDDPVDTHSQTKTQNSPATAPASPPTYEFDVVSIKLLDSFTDPGGVTFEPSGIIARDISLWWLLRMAYGAQRGEVLHTPDWIDDVRFNFEARIDADTAEAIQKLSKEQQTVVQQQMLRAMLADRFKLTAHTEPRELPAYILTVAADGPKLQAAKLAADDPKALTDIHGNRLAGVVLFANEAAKGQEGFSLVITGQSASVTEFAAQLSRRMDHPVVDKTGLTGVYNFMFRCQVEPSLSPPASSEGGSVIYDNPLTSKAFAKAMEKDLGLKLTPAKTSINALVIDHVERPSPN